MKKVIQMDGQSSAREGDKKYYNLSADGQLRNTQGVPGGMCQTSGERSLGLITSI
jgi:hypothetical protein